MSEASPLKLSNRETSTEMSKENPDDRKEFQNEKDLQNLEFDADEEEQ